MENYSFISDAINKLETEDMPLNESIHVFDKVGQILQSINDTIYEEFERIVNNNPGNLQLKGINDIFSVEEELSTNYLVLEEIICFKRASVSSGVVERSFSKHKMILSYLCHSLSENSLKSLMTINCKKNVLNENNSFIL